MNKKGWIRIAEAFVSILIVIGAALVAIKGGIQEDDVYEQIYDIEISISKEIRLNDSLRNEILGTSGTVEWDDFPTQTKNKIIENAPNELECLAKICPIENTCLLEEESEKNIYVHSISLFSTLTSYSPKIIKLFCIY